MARFTMRGMEEYELKLSKLASGSKAAGGKAVYAAAAIVADEVRKGINALPERSGYGTPEHPVRGVTKRGKQGLLDGFGISKMEETDGYLHVKLGFDGYNSIKTDKYPQGQPNQLVARGVESGASWIEKTPFVRPAMRKTQKSAVKAMQNIIDEETEKIMG